MAIDPATAKLIAKAAISVATDKEKRKRFFMVILGIVVGLLLFIALVTYIITSPLSLLLGWLLPNEVTVVEDFQKDYGYNQSIGIYDADTLESSGQNYEGVVFTDGATEVTYYNQMDTRWADTMYGISEIPDSELDKACTGKSAIIGCPCGIIPLLAGYSESCGSCPYFTCDSTEKKRCALKES